MTNFYCCNDLQHDVLYFTILANEEFPVAERSLNMALFHNYVLVYYKFQHIDTLVEIHKFLHIVRF